MSALRIVLTVIFILVCIVLAAIVLMQEGKSAGLGTISGAADTYWGQNKGRSMSGILEKLTTVLAVVFIVLALVLNLNFGHANATDTGVEATAAPTQAVTTTAAPTEATDATATEAADATDAPESTETAE